MSHSGFKFSSLLLDEVQAMPHSIHYLLLLLLHEFEGQVMLLPAHGEVVHVHRLLQRLDVVAAGTGGGGEEHRQRGDHEGAGKLNRA